MRIMAFDASTSTIGWTILDCKNKKITSFKVDYFKPSKKGTIFERLFDTKQKIIALLDKYKPTHVVIENIVEFMAQKSSAKTIIALAVLNRTVGLTIFEALKQEPALLNVNTVRSAIKPLEHEGRVVKEEIPDLLDNYYNFQYKKKYKKNGEYAPETYDMADSLALGLAYAKKEFGVELHFKK